MVGFTAEERSDLKSILVAVMYLCNVDFLEQEEHCSLKEEDALKRVAELLQVRRVGGDARRVHACSSSSSSEVALYPPAASFVFPSPRVLICRTG